MSERPTDAQVEGLVKFVGMLDAEIDNLTRLVDFINPDAIGGSGWRIRLEFLRMCAAEIADGDFSIFRDDP